MIWESLRSSSTVWWSWQQSCEYLEDNISALSLLCVIYEPYLGTAPLEELSILSWSHCRVLAGPSLQFVSGLHNFNARMEIYIHLVCGYVASCRILSTNSHVSGSSLNCYCMSACASDLSEGQAQKVNVPGSKLLVRLFAAHQRVSKYRADMSIYSASWIVLTESPRPS